MMKSWRTAQIVAELVTHEMERGTVHFVTVKERSALTAKFNSKIHQRL